MKTLRILSIFLIAAVLATPLAAQEKDDKIGTVNMQKLLSEYYKTDQTRKEFKQYEEEVMKKNQTRVEAIKAMDEEARKLSAQGEDPSLSRDKRAELLKQLRMKQQEAQALRNDRLAWIQRSQSALSEKANVEFSLLRAEIIKMVQEVGEAEGYDYIFDRSGASGANVPILSYAKDATDLTAKLLLRINQNAPSGEDQEKEDGDKDPE